MNHKINVVQCLMDRPGSTWPTRGRQVRERHLLKADLPAQATWVHRVGWRWGARWRGQQLGDFGGRRTGQLPAVEHQGKLLDGREEQVQIEQKSDDHRGGGGTRADQAVTGGQHGNSG